MKKWLNKVFGIGGIIHAVSSRLDIGNAPNNTLSLDIFIIICGILLLIQEEK